MAFEEWADQSEDEFGEEFDEFDDGYSYGGNPSGYDDDDYSYGDDDEEEDFYE